MLDQQSCIVQLQFGKDFKKAGITHCVTSKYTCEEYTKLLFDCLILSVTTSTRIFKVFKVKYLTSLE